MDGFVKFVISLAVVVVGAVLIVSGLFDSSPHEVRSHREPVEVCERYVKHYDPGAGVGAFREALVDEFESAKYRVDASMNAANGTGPVRRIDYVCELGHDDETGRWNLLRLQLDGKQVFPES